jgi:hypothetical protein
MKKLDVQDLFEYGRAAIAILRSLEVHQLTMSYAVPARGIDLRSNEMQAPSHHSRLVPSQALHLPRFRSSD